MTTKAEVWRERLMACGASGESTAAFCRTHGWPYAQYMYWQRRLGQAPTGLVPVRVEEPALAAPALAVEVGLSGGQVLRVHGATAADVVALVRGLAC